MTRFQQFHIDTNVWDDMIFTVKYSFGSFPQHLETEAVLQTVHSTGLGFAVDCDGLLSALGWGPFVLKAMNIMKESDLALNPQHTHTSMMNWSSTNSLPFLWHIHPDKFHFITLDFIGQCYWDQLSRFPDMSYHLWSKERAQDQSAKVCVLDKVASQSHWRFHIHQW